MEDSKQTVQMGASKDNSGQTIQHDVEQEVADTTVSKSRFYIILATLSLVLSMNGLDSNVLGDAAPVISVVFGTENISWLATIAFVTATCLVLPMGMMYRRLEPKWILLASLVIFMIGEAVSGSARTFTALMIGRFFVGVAFASTPTAAFLIVGLLCRDTAQRAIYISLVTALYGVMIKVGPLVAGGFLKISHSYWRWCFYVQLPIAATCVLLVLVTFPSFRTTEMKNAERKLNLRNVFSIAISSVLQAMLVLALTLPGLLGGSNFDWDSGLLITCYVWIVPGVACFILWEWRAQDECRLLPIGQFMEQRRFGLISIVTFCSILATFAVTYYLPIYFQIVEGSSPLRAAVQLLPLVISGTIGCVLVGKVVEVTGNYFYCCVVGSAVQILGAGLFYSIDSETSTTVNYIYQVILGLGSGSLSAIGLTVALHDIARAQFARTVAWMEFVLVLAAAIGVGGQGAMLTSQLKAAAVEISRLVGGVDSASLTFNQFLLYLETASSSDAIVVIGRNHVITAQNYASLMYLVAGAISLIASACMPRGRL